jgi:hypothetical protein
VLVIGPTTNTIVRLAEGLSDSVQLVNDVVAVFHRELAAAVRQPCPVSGEH